MEEFGGQSPISSAARLSSVWFMKETTDTPPGVALITGASRGLGRALAHELARDGWHLIITARNVEDLETTAEELRVTSAMQG